MVVAAVVVVVVVVVVIVIVAAGVGGAGGAAAVANDVALLLLRLMLPIGVALLLACRCCCKRAAIYEMGLVTSTKERTCMVFKSLTNYISTTIFCTSHTHHRSWRLRGYPLKHDVQCLLLVSTNHIWVKPTLNLGVGQPYLQPRRLEVFRPRCQGSGTSAFRARTLGLSLRPQDPSI